MQRKFNAEMAKKEYEDSSNVRLKKKRKIIKIFSAILFAIILIVGIVLIICANSNTILITGVVLSGVGLTGLGIVFGVPIILY